MKIRLLQSEDIGPLLKLYRRETKPLSFLPRVRKQQFAEHLNVSRCYQPERLFNPDAEIAFVAERSGRPVAYAGGGVMVDGDFLAPAGTGVIRFVLGERGCRAGVSAVIKAVVDHLLEFQPKKIEAFSGLFSPVFFANGCGFLPAAWSWLGACLRDAGFEVAGRHFTMLRDLTGRGNVPRPIPFPKGFTLSEEKTPVLGEVLGLHEKFNVGWMLHDKDGFAGWCGNFYSGAFIRGSGFDHVYTHWFTVSERLQGQGLGRRLLRHGLVAAHQAGAQTATLMTDVDNFIALNLYQSEGYRAVDTGCSFTMKLEDSAFRNAASAVSDSDHRTLRRLLKKNPDLVRAREGTEVPPRQPTLLHLAAGGTSKQIVKALVSAGANVNATDREARGDTPLLKAVRNGNRKLAECLIEAGADIEADHERDQGGMSALNVALFNNKLDMSHMLVARGAMITFPLAAGLGRMDLLETWFDQNGQLKPSAGENYWSPSQRPSGMPTQKDLDELLIAAFMHACINGQIQAMEFLLDKGVDIDAHPQGFGGIAATGLHRASWFGHLDAVKFLVERGADLTIRDDVHSGTPRDWAEANNNVKIRDYLAAKAPS